MLQTLTASALSAILLTLGVFNWCTTCCCGNSMILEILHGGCAPHEDETGHPADRHPDNNDQHPCHKPGGSAFLAASDPDLSLAVVPVAWVQPVEGNSGANFFVGTSPPDMPADWGISKSRPPDIPLMIQSWLI
jgi:hypothetical protein